MRNITATERSSRAFVDAIAAAVLAHGYESMAETSIATSTERVIENALGGAVGAAFDLAAILAEIDGVVINGKHW
jgi:hypothetical protein